MLLFIAMLGLSWYTAVSEAVNNPKKVQEHLQKAAELEEKGIYVDAVTEYEQALVCPGGVGHLYPDGRCLPKRRRQQEICIHL